MREFKVGDGVYFPKKSNKVLTLGKNENGYKPYPLEVSDVGFTVDGKYNPLDALPIIYHATPENRALLEQLYGVEFEAPPTKPTSREIIQAMLERGDKSVSCWVSKSHEKPRYVNGWGFICQVTDTHFIDHFGTSWEYATPFDPRTEQPITELPE